MKCELSNENIGNRLREFRTAAGLELGDIANRIGTSIEQVQKFETGVNRISAFTLIKFAIAADFTLDRFVEVFDTELNHNVDITLPPQERSHNTL